MFGIIVVGVVLFVLVIGYDQVMVVFKIIVIGV